MISLFRKEWHEQAWKLGFGCLVLGTLALLAFRARLLADDTTALWICFVGVTLLPITASTGLIPAERGDGTLEMLLALPVQRWQVLLVKTVSGAALIIVPILLAGVIALPICHGREMPAADLFAVHLRSAATALLLFIWMQAMTAGLPSEARAGMIAVAVLIMWELITVGLTLNPPRVYSGIVRLSVPIWSLSVSPMVFVYGITEGFINSPPLIFAILAQGLIAVGLWLLTIVQLRSNNAVD